MRLKASLSLLVIALLLPASALGKSVRVEWKEIQGAVQYELEVMDGSGKIAAKVNSEKPAWKGDLTAGLYTYRLRGHDWMKRPGKWSLPKPLVVMPPAPELDSPKSGEAFRTFGNFGTVILKWKPVAGIRRFKVEVKSRKSVVFASRVIGDTLVLPKLAPGAYEWSVAPVMEAEAGRAPASLAGRAWDGAAESRFNFEIERQKLQAPVALSPKGMVRPPQQGRQLFEWKPVDGATSYRVQVFRVFGINRGLAPVGPPLTIDAKESSLAVRIPGEGLYRWKVAALAKPDVVGEPIAVSREALSDFEVNRNAVFLQGTGYVAGSLMVAPYTYQAISPLAGRQFSAEASALVVRGSGEYWLRSKVGVAAAVENTAFRIDARSYNRAAFEFHGKLRLQIDDRRNGWFFAPKAGVELRDYLHLIWFGTGTTTAMLESKATKYRTLGPSLGFDLRKEFSDSWSLGGKFLYFLPLGIYGGESGTRLTPDASLRNFSFGLQGLYWIQKEWSLAVGFFLDKRSISFQAPRATKPEMLYMDGSYFFGSVIYSFGRGQ
ncbi:MAG: hypothetical protein NDJ90_12195 [Oligoflexia bacterium]|nr:hypothetical protein [Oligoflexia bacterium]